MKAIQIISQDLFDKIRSRFQNLEMGDKTGAVTLDPSDALFFDFDFIHEGINLGRVSISLNDLGSLKIYYSQGITENKDEISKRMWYSFLKEMRFFAMRRLLRFDTRDISKTNLDKNDFQYLAAKNQKEEITMNMNESRWNYRNSKKTSRAVKGKTQVIVRHHKPVDEMFSGSRSQRKNIKAIYIENSDGERFKYPFIHTAGAFAMAQHVDHGGIPHDSAGKAIIRMSEQIAQLQEFSKQIQHTQLHDDAMGITERAVSRLQELKSQIEALGKRHYYESWIAEFSESDEPIMAELDPVTMEQYKAKFTQSNFKEELANYFPLIHSIMQETNKIDLESYVQEGTCSECHKDPCECDNEEKEVKEGTFDQFEEWAEAVEQGKLTDDQVAELKSAIESLPGGTLELGPDGQTAWQFFSGFGLSDSDLESKLKSAAELDPSTNPLEVLQVWAQENYPELLVALGMSGTAQAEPQEPIEPPENPEPATDQEQPVAESDDLRGAVLSVLHNIYTGAMAGEEMIDDVADELGDYYDDVQTSGDKNLQMAYSLVREKGADAEGDPQLMASIAKKAIQMLSSPTQQPVAEGKDDWIQEVAKLVKSRYNAANESVGPFNGYENIALDVKKEIGEKFGDKLGEKAELVAKQFMEKLTKEWEDRHGKQVGAVDQDDGLSRLKELIGSVKTKLEAIDPKNPRDYERPAVDRKAAGQAPLTMKDIDDKDNSSPTTSAGLEKRKAELGISEIDVDASEAMSRHAKGYEKYGKDGMNALRQAAQNGAGKEKMDKIRKQHDQYNEEVALIRKLSGMAK